MCWVTMSFVVVLVMFTSYYCFDPTIFNIGSVQNRLGSISGRKGISEQAVLWDYEILASDTAILHNF